MQKLKINAINKAIFIILISVSTSIAQNSFVGLNGIPGAYIDDIHKDANGKLYIVDYLAKQIYSSSDLGLTWQLFDVGASDIYAFYADGNDLYYFQYSQMYKSTDGGANWVRVNSLFESFKNIRRAYKSPVDANTWIVEANCEGVYISTDNGVTWTNIVTETCGSGSDGEYKLSLAANGDVYFENRNFGVFRHKKPADNSWDNSKVEQVFSKQTSSDDNSIKLMVGSSGRVFIAHRDINGLFRLSSSTTGDVGSFSEFTLPITTTNLDNSTVSKSFDGKLYLTSYFGNEMYELTEETTPVWTAKVHPTNQFGSEINVLLTWISASEIFGTTNGSGVFRSTDGGASWQMRNGTGTQSLFNGNASDVEVLPNGNIVVYQGYGPKGTWVSTDQGNSFSFHSFGETSFRRGNGTGFIKLQDNSLLMRNQVGIMRSTDGINWTVVSGTEDYELAIPVSGGDIYFVRNNSPSLYKVTLTDITDGGGITPVAVAAGLPTNYSARDFIAHDGDFYLDLLNNDSGQWELWKIERAVTPFTSQKLITPFTLDNSRGIVSISNKLYLSNGDLVAYSVNQGVSWATIDYVAHESLFAINQEAGGIALGSRSTFSVTQDDGQTWATFGLPTSGGVVTSITQDAAANFIAAQSGGPMVKFSGKLVLSAAELPTPVNISWQPLNGPYGGNVDGLVHDSQGNIFAYARGAGVFKLPAGSDTWQRANTGLNEGRIAYVAENDDVYAADYNRIAKSTDNGVTWSIISENTALDVINLTVANNGNIVVSSTQGGEGLYVSTDGGSSYSKPLGNGSKGNFYELIKSGTGRLWTHQRFNGQSTLYTSTDNGISWLPLNSIDLSNGKRVLSINRLEGNVVTVVTDSDILSSADDGSTWTSIKNTIAVTEHYPQEPAYSRVYLAPDNSYYFYNLQEVYKSTDSGATWAEVGAISNQGRTLTDITWQGNDILASASTGILRSAEGINNFNDFNSGLTAVYNYSGSFVPAGNTFFTAPNGWGLLFKSIDDGQTFNRYSSSEGYFDGIIKDPDGKIIRFGIGLSYSIDNGVTWSANSSNQYYGMMVSRKDEGTGLITYYALRTNNSFLDEYAKSTDLVNWTTLGAAGLPISEFFRNNLVAGSNDILYTIGYNAQTAQTEFYRIAFGSAERITDTNTNGTTAIQFNPVAKEPASSDDLKKSFVLYGSQGKLAYSDDGYTWKSTAAPPSLDGNEFKITDNGYYFINDIQSGRMWISKDEGASWQFTNGFNSTLFEIEINPSNGYAYAIARGQVVQKSNSIILENDLTNPVIAAQNGLAPENGAINIPLDFQLAITFDENVIPVAGKKIRLLEKSNPGTPVEIFDAADALVDISGKTVSFTPSVSIDYSTEYFIAMDAGAFTDIFGNPAAGISGTNVWAFTTLAVPDNTQPSITVTTGDLNYVKGASKSFAITVTDNQEVNALSGKIYYRKISDLSNVPFQTANLTAAGGDAASVDFSITTLDSWYDEIGLEFYFEVADKAGNIRRNPELDNAYLYSYIDYANSKPKLTNEQLSFGSTASSFRIISVPFNLTDNQIATQFNELGEQSKEKFRIGHYNNAKGSVDEYPANLKTLGRGEGYWIILRNFTEIEFENAKVFENNRNDFYEINLKQGWNQIGNPYPVAVSWEEIRQQDTAVGDLKMYRNGSWQGDVAILPAYQGGFVFATSDVNNLKIRFSGITTGGRIEKTSTDLAAEYWELPIKISQGDFSSSIGGIGMHQQSKDGIDRYDDYNPPGIADRLELIFSNVDSAPLAKSIVAPAENQVWSFTAYSEGNENVTLEWDNNALGENNIGLWLYDEERVALIDMRTQAKYGYLAKPTKKFRIYYGNLPEIEVEPTLSLLGEPWPNPATGLLQIPFTITDDMGTSKVILSLYNAQGKEVAKITEANYQPGVHTVRWYNRQNNNETGLHLLQWTLITEQGLQIQETKRIVLK